MHPSHQILWDLYRQQVPDAPIGVPDSFCFCDNAQDADLCADLVVRGVKRATAASLAELELQGQSVPQVGEYSLVTDWSGKARAIIRTRHVEIRRLGDVDAAFAALEGEGDGSLAWWREAHLAYYGRVLAGTGITIDDDLLIACEAFDCVLGVD